MNTVDSLVPRGDQTSGSQGLANSVEVALNKVKYVMKLKDTHETRFFSPPLIPRIAASPTGVSWTWLRPKIVE